MKIWLPVGAALAAVSFQNTDGWALFGKRKRKLGMPPLPEEVRRPKGDKDLLDMLDQSEKWIDAQKETDTAFFDHLRETNMPNYFVIGCSDARFSANEIMGEPVGSVFVTCNVANMVVNSDNNLLSALHFAVEYLRVPHIIVCGHYDCGGVRASVSRLNHQPPLENWLRNVRHVYRVHREELDAILDPEQRHRRLVELNVMEQCVNVYKTETVQRRRLESSLEGADFATPHIHGVVFDPKDGILKRVSVDFKNMTDDLDGIYDLYAEYVEIVEDASP